MTTLAEIFYDDSLETRGKLKKIYNLSQSGVLCESEQKIVNQKNFEEVFKNFPKNGSIVDLFKELAIKSAKLKFWIIAFLISTSLTCVEAIYFIRQSGNSNKCILLSFLLVIAFARAPKRFRNEIRA